MICSMTLQAANAQITLEQTYPNAYSYSSDIDFGITFFDDTTTKYYLIYYPNETITLYNMNHSLFLSMTIPVTYNSGNYRIYFITNSLFDCDTSNIEYLVSYRFYNGVSYVYFVSIYRNNGTQLFNLNNAIIDQCYECNGKDSHGITNTPNGTKMLLGDYPTGGNEYVYSLCGTLPSGFTSLMNNSYNAFELSGNYPNPANDFTIVNYSLPEGERTGEIIFFDLQGNEVKRFTVDCMFDHLRISTYDLPSGTYIYALQTSKEISGSRKMIKID